MSKRESLKSNVKKFMDEAVLVEIDLWPGIRNRLQQAAEQKSAEYAGADRDGNPNWYKKRLSEVLQNLIYSYKNKKELPMEEEKEGRSVGITRRDFMKVSGTAATSAAVINFSQRSVLRTLEEIEPAAEVDSEEKIFYGSCRTACPAGCRLKIHVRDGKIVKMSGAEMPDPDYNCRPCLKGLSYPQLVYGAERLKYPMRRAGERGEGKWERISWDEAINTITSTWKRLQADYGDSSIAVHSPGGNLGVLGAQPYARLKNLIGATNLTSVTDRALPYANSYSIGGGPFMGGNEPIDYRNAKCIIVWGNNVQLSFLQNWHFIADAMENGTKLIVIDPVYTPTAAKADYRILIKPATDAALAMAMINVVVEEGYSDEEFLRDYTVGPLLIKASDGKYLRNSDVTGIAPEEGAADLYIIWDLDANDYTQLIEKFDRTEAITDQFGNIVSTGAEKKEKPTVNAAIHGTYTINGISVTTAYDLLLEKVAEYTPEKAEEICGVPAETIREISRIYATNTPATLYPGMGMDHYANAHYAFFAMNALAMVTGNLGKAGASASMGASGGFYANWVGLLYPEGVKPGPSVALIRLNDVVKAGALNGNSYTVKSLMFSGGNPLGNYTHPQKILELMEDVELVVTVNITMCESAQYADIVLPVTSYFEIDDMQFFNQQHPYLVLQEKAIEPLYECKSDFKIANLLAEGMGVGDKMVATEEEFMTLALDSALAKSMGITYEKLKQEKVMRHLPGETYIFAGGGYFLTQTGRAQFYNETPKPDSYFEGQEIDIEKERWPHYEPPLEAWAGNPLFEKYPLQIFSPGMRTRVHTIWGQNVPWLRDLEDPEPVAHLNPIDAQPRGISSGDKIKIFNDRGYVVLVAKLTDGMCPGMVGIPRGRMRGEFTDGHYGYLTHANYNSACVNQNFYDVLAQVEKI